MDQAALQSTCLEAPGLCVLAQLPAGAADVAKGALGGKGRCRHPHACACACVRFACALTCLSRPASDPAEKGGPLGTLRSLAGKRAEQPLAFAWISDAPEHHALAAALGIDSAPALAALAPKKGRFAAFTGRFDEDAISEWLDGLLAGRVRTAPLPEQLPPLAADAGASDGSAAEQGDSGSSGDAAAEEPLEDEFSLDEIMAEEVEKPVQERPHDEL